MGVSRALPVMPEEPYFESVMLRCLIKARPGRTTPDRGMNLEQTEGNNVAEWQPT